jgi:hypothetical protein
MEHPLLCLGGEAGGACREVPPVRWSLACAVGLPGSVLPARTGAPVTMARFTASLGLASTSRRPAGPSMTTVA